MDENNLEDENLESSNLEEPVEEPRSEGVVDSVSRTATHTAGRAVATAYGGAIGGKIYDVASNTKIGQAIEESVSKKISLRLKLILIGVGLGTCLIFFIIFSIFISNGDMGTGSGLTDEGCVKFQANCDNKAAQLMAKIVYYNAGNSDLFTQLTTASVALNNAGGSSYDEIYNLSYLGFTLYKDIDFEEYIPDSHKGRMLYVAEVVLSGKYNIPKNITLKSDNIDVEIFGEIWTEVQFYPLNGVTVLPINGSFGYEGDSLSDTDIFGNELPSNAYSDNDKSVEYFKKLAKELELDDYSGYTEDKVCANYAPVDLTCKTVSLAGYGTMSLDEYVSGVVAGEVGGYLDDGLNTYKSVAIAARSYFVASVNGDHPYTSNDGNGNCTLNTNGPTFQNYSSSVSDETTKAANETSGIVLLKDNNVYRSEYDALCIDHEDKTNYYLCQGGENEKNMVLPISWIVNKTSAGYVAETRLWAHGRGMSQNGAWYLALEKGWTFDKILNYFYGDEGASVSAGGGASAPTKCTNGSSGSFTPLETYNLRHEGLDVLNRTLSSTELSDLNNYIETEINKAGFGTGAGVAAAGQALTYWLEQKGYYLQYRWGGKYSYVGASPEWGGTSHGTDWNSGSPRYYYGMDCTGFTSWAITNACKPSGKFSYASDYSALDGAKRISIREAKPGDMVEIPGHIQLIVKNNGDGSLIVAEETGGGTSGLVFSRVDNSSLLSWYGEYYITDMSGYYESQCERK